MKLKVLAIILSLLVIIGIVLSYEKYQMPKEEKKDSFIDSNETTNNFESKTTSNQEKANKETNKETNERIGRLEISSLNRKEDLFSSQIQFTTNGLNKEGNTVLLLEDSSYIEITQDTEIYVRNLEEEKVIYKVYSIYETNISDTRFYNVNTEQVELTLVVKKNDTSILVIQARKET